MILKNYLNLNEIFPTFLIFKNAWEKKSFNASNELITDNFKEQFYKLLKREYSGRLTNFYNSSLFQNAFFKKLDSISLKYSQQFKNFKFVGNDNKDNEAIPSSNQQGDNNAYQNQNLNTRNLIPMNQLLNSFVSEFNFLFQNNPYSAQQIKEFEDDQDGFTDADLETATTFSDGNTTFDVLNYLNNFSNNLENDISTNTNNISKNSSDISTNTNSINTLNNIITANFETFGRYQIMGNSLSDTAGEVRFNIIEQIPLNAAYINVSLTPNQFINLKAGKITFNIIADGIINNESVDLIIELKIYKNTEVLDTESKVIEAGKTISINFAGTFDVAENDTCYATLQIVNGIGSLVTNNNVIIAIDFKSDNIQQAIKSDQVVDSFLELPTTGINPWRNDINNNSENINKINSETILLQTNVSTGGFDLPESILNFKEIEIYGKLIFNDYDNKTAVLSFSTSFFDINIEQRHHFIFFATGGGDRLEIIFESDKRFRSNRSEALIFYMIGKGRIS